MLISLLIVHSRLLAQHPVVLAKLRGEINSIVGVGKESRLPDRNALKRMRYLNLVFKEGMSVFMGLTLIRWNSEQDPLIVIRSASTLPFCADQLSHRAGGYHAPNRRRS